MPPAVTISDDERLLLAVAAGVGRAAPELADAVSRVSAKRSGPASMRQVCLDIWAEALAAGAPRLTESTAHRAFSMLRAPSAGRSPQTAQDWTAAYWMVTRLLTAPWSPSDDDRLVVEQLLGGARRAALAAVCASSKVGVLDASLLLDALIATPVSPLGRRSALEDVLAIVDCFAASAAVLSARQRGKPPFEIRDEYDVQDLFRALLLPLIPDLQPEDPASKIAGKGARLDFTSRKTRLGFELKHVTSASRVAAVRDEVLLDERIYHAHPYVETVVVFIHDPKRFIRLGDRPAFEADLSTTVSVDGRSVRYVARVR
jgi:hypothetical protein